MGISILIFMIPAVITVTGVSGQCSFPSNVIQTRWWYGYTTTGGITKELIQQFTSDKTIVRNADNTGTPVEYQCKSTFIRTKYTYYVRRLLGQTSQDECVEMQASSNIIISKRRIEAPGLTANQCPSKLGSSAYIAARLLFRYPLNFDQSACPSQLYPGIYQTTFTVDGSSTSCTNVATSLTTIDSKTMRINTCYTGTVNFYNPFKSTLTCVGSIVPSDIYQRASDGQIVVLAYRDPSTGRYSFYCGRYYPNPFDNKLYLSIFAKNDMAVCEHFKNYQTADDQTTSKYRAFVFTPADCINNVCKNGATCVQSLGSYRCTCAPGYQGRNCTLRAVVNVSNPNYPSPGLIAVIFICILILIALITALAIQINLMDTTRRKK